MFVPDPASPRHAVAHNPEIAGYARDDEDFTSLRDDPEFGELVRRRQ